MTNPNAIIKIGPLPFTVAELMPEFNPGETAKLWIEHGHIADAQRLMDIQYQEGRWMRRMGMVVCDFEPFARQMGWGNARDGIGKDEFEILRSLGMVV